MTLNVSFAYVSDIFGVHTWYIVYDADKDYGLERMVYPTEAFWITTDMTGTKSGFQCQTDISDA